VLNHYVIIHGNDTNKRLDLETPPLSSYL